MKAETKHCGTCEYVAKEVVDYPCCECENHCFYKCIYEPIISKIEKEMYKLNAEGDFVYSVSEIKVFDKCLEILKGEDE